MVFEGFQGPLLLTLKRASKSSVYRVSALTGAGHEASRIRIDNVPGNPSRGPASSPGPVWYGRGADTETL